MHVSVEDMTWLILKRLVRYRSSFCCEMTLWGPWDWWWWYPLEHCVVYTQWEHTWCVSGRWRHALRCVHCHHILPHEALFTRPKPHMDCPHTHRGSPDFSTLPPLPSLILSQTRSMSQEVLFQWLSCRHSIPSFHAAWCLPWSTHVPSYAVF